jgi:hypothetical protein
MFGNWLNEVDKKDKAYIGLSALYWSRWTCGNNIVFSQTKGCKFVAGYLAAHRIELLGIVLRKIKNSSA